MLPDGIPVIRPDVPPAEPALDLRGVPGLEQLARLTGVNLALVTSAHGISAALTVAGPRVLCSKDLEIHDFAFTVREEQLADTPMAHMLKDTRDQKLLEELVRLHEQRCQEPITVRVVYGAAHMPAVCDGLMARDMERRQQGTTDLAWWHLWGAAPKPLAGLVVGSVAGAVGALAVPWRGWGIGVVCAYVVGLLVRKRIRSGTPSLAAGLAGGLLGGLLAALVALTVFGTGAGNTRLSSFLADSLGVAIAVSPMSRFHVGLAGTFVGVTVIAFYERATAFDSIRLSVGDGAYLINGLALGLVAGLAAGLFNRRVPARGLRWSPVGFACGIGGGLLFGFVIGFTTGPAVGLVCGGFATISGGLAGGLYEAAVPTDLTKAAAPPTVLARDRTTFLVSLALAVPFALSIILGAGLSPPDPFNGTHYGFGYATGLGIAFFLAIGLGFAFHQASWGTFNLTRWWLAASGRLPLRLMTFLDDAHTNRGVLRQVGAVYQFRHVDLQRRLAKRSQSPDPVTTGTDPVGWR